MGIGALVDEDAGQLIHPNGIPVAIQHSLKEDGGGGGGEFRVQATCRNKYLSLNPLALPIQQSGDPQQQGGTGRVTP